MWLIVWKKLVSGLRRGDVKRYLLSVMLEACELLLYRRTVHVLRRRQAASAGEREDGVDDRVTPSSTVAAI